jgi:DNA-binding IclR family transcriptional regulator
MNSPIDNQARPSGPRVRPVPAVSRAVAILRLLGRNAAPMPLKAIASELDMISSTCLHILRVLVDEGLVKVEAGTKQYTLGVGMLALARNVIERNPFPSLVQPVLDKIAAQWGVTAIGVEVNGVDHMAAAASRRFSAPPGAWSPPSPTCRTRRSSAVSRRCAGTSRPT